ncbi:cation:proton antiporter [Salinimonas chungwhensis]|uniref:cation:proton antiporter n=1 Tax=Salinimonas chungwhensis TaxID=265425 RepID=UPI00036F712D|nr:monovalent cation/H(+) antiporter subunit G [Salinimonas chungwhensis]
MMMITDIFTFICLIAGCGFFFSGSLALLRFPGTLSRLHALTKVDNLGLGLVVIGTIPQTDTLLQAMQILLIWFLVTFSGAAGAFFIARKHYNRRPAK